MAALTYLIYYCVAILLASVFGGMIPKWWNLTHRWMEIAVSFVAGIIFGVAMLHMLPHAILSALQSSAQSPHATLLGLMVWFVLGFLAMFLIERFFCFHHHEAPADHSFDPPHEHHHDLEHDHEHGCSHQPHSDHVHDITWSGAAVGLTLHSVLAGVALAASVMHGHGGGTLPGLGTFLVIVLHKPFDAMTIATLMGRSGWSVAAQSMVNALFSLAIPLGAGLFLLGVSPDVGPVWFALPAALAFSSGVFLCIAGSDLLPELQFHHHDRWKLSAALILGLGVAYLAGRFEGHTHNLPLPNTPAATKAES
ncbi:ZIP family metal transporter [Aeoliella mucimassa]|uniref:Zinc transporter ZupT n=1 Tax=Aeoliella mucimassa TaxID=2527972 RepID=A0A518AMC5_9BACT|nr:ZIP family metal transporter [Aeoliella mucimassa]QDU55866.1 zinc transporter ZupT [Aeoliella mucimassa]